MAKFDELIKKEGEERKAGLQDGDILDIDNIIDVKDSKFEANNRTVYRKVYVYKDNSSIEIPVTVHKMIKDLRLEYGEEMPKVKIKKEGTGFDTKYSVFPQLKGGKK